MKCQIAFNKLRPGGECEEQLEPTHVAQWAKNEKVCFFDFADKTGILAEFFEKFCFSGFMDFWRGSQLFHFLGGFELPLSLCDGTNWLCNSLFHAKSSRVRVDKY